jgi:hypothetical protein
MYEKEGVGEETLLDKTPPTVARYPSDVSPDGQLLASTESTTKEYDIRVMTVADGNTTSFLSTSANEMHPRFRRTAATSNTPPTRRGSSKCTFNRIHNAEVESGRCRSGAAHSRSGGTDGSELFYIASDGKTER